MTETILVFQPITDELRSIIEGLLPADFRLTTTTSSDPAHQRAMLAEADYLIFWDEALTDSVLTAAPRLKLAHKWGVGIENIDIDAARKHKVPVARTTGGNAVPVSEFAVGLMLAAGRQIVTAHTALTDGRWIKDDVYRKAILLSGKTVGILGMGAIGSLVAQRVRAFDCKVIYHNRKLSSKAAELGADLVSFDELLAQSDFLVLTCPLTPETRGKISAPQLAAMKSRSVLVNIARGGIVNEADLIDALRRGHPAAAAVDVFDPEPPKADNPLLKLPNVVVTPHIASFAIENSARGVKHWLRNIMTIKRGEPLPDSDRVA